MSSGKAMEEFCEFLYRAAKRHLQGKHFSSKQIAELLRAVDILKASVMACEEKQAVKKEWYWREPEAATASGPFESPEAAADDAREQEQKAVMIGECQKPDPESCARTAVDVDAILESMHDIETDSAWIEDRVFTDMPGADLALKESLAAWAKVYVDTELKWLWREDKETEVEL